MSENYSKYYILVVDDEMIMREYLWVILSDHGFQVEKVESGEKAVEAMDQKQYDLIISDLKMPGMSGMDVLKYSKENQTHAKVVLMTAYAMDMNVKNYLDQGAFGFILKPFDINQIRKIVFSAFDEKTE